MAPSFTTRSNAFMPSTHRPSYSPMSQLSIKLKYRRSAVIKAQQQSDNFPERLINQISVAVTNFEPLNAGKKWIASLQAGGYDESEIAAKVDQYIADNQVCLLSSQATLSFSLCSAISRHYLHAGGGVQLDSVSILHKS